MSDLVTPGVEKFMLVSSMVINLPKIADRYQVLCKMIHQMFIICVDNKRSGYKRCVYGRLIW